MSNVRCNYIEAENCVLINVTADRIIMKSGSIAYNVIDEKKFTGDISEHCTPRSVGVKDGESINNPLLQLDEKSVVCGVFDHDGKQHIIRSHIDNDGGNLLLFFRCLCDLFLVCLLSCLFPSRR
jgi:hypothetical protein